MRLPPPRDRHHDLRVRNWPSGRRLSIIDILTWLYYQEVDLAASPRARGDE
jgi:hypothetical protein